MAHQDNFHKIGVAFVTPFLVHHQNRSCTACDSFPSDLPGTHLRRVHPTESHNRCPRPLPDQQNRRRPPTAPNPLLLSFECPMSPAQAPGYVPHIAPLNPLIPQESHFARVCQNRDSTKGAVLTLIFLSKMRP